MRSVFPLMLLLSLSPVVCRAADPEAVDFSQDVLPLLEQRCLECHGEDRSGGLRLDRRHDALLPTDSGEPAIVPGDPESGAILERITSGDADRMMPPDGPPLTNAEVDVLRRWIVQGADYPEERSGASVHWAYRKPQRPTPPEVQGRDWARNPIDRFVLAKLEATGLPQSEAAEQARRLRRASLALTGLPPSLEVLDQFLSDRRPDAYERAIDCLLESSSFGEHWARPWLDLARYADSNGYQADQLRDSWAYRDWVIDAMNRDMPFDQFVVEQLAGDLLPEATPDQKIATGLHRATTCNVEAGVHPEENRVNQVFDRVNTTGTALLGTTLECAQCHNHKYDPFTQREYYEFFAFFNNTPLEVEKNSGVRYNFVGPLMELPTVAAEREARDDLERRIADLERQREELTSPAERKQRLDAHLEELREQIDALRPPTTLVMVEQSEPRTTHVMRRGNYLDPGPEVKPSTPAALHPFDDNLPRNRLGLARWIADPDNPLLARVTVNRWWTEMFGRGLVETPEDFGTRADPPTHPELLDWLAVELIDSGWSRKHVLRLIATSAAFQQASAVTPEAHRRDPQNRLYGRGPRARMAAETIRDQALAAAGLLSSKMHGDPVMPHQPDGVWRAVGRNPPQWKSADDEDRFRRGVYIVWRRAAPYPSFVNFDAPDRASCTVQRPTTNTPLQALTLLNDTAYVEAALGLAYRTVIDLPQAAAAERVEYAFRCVLARMPSDRERSELLRLYQEERERFAGDIKAVDARLRAFHGVDLSADFDRIDLAAWSVVCSVLLNLDETVTRG